MALGGGTFLVQNKVLPGAYINFVSKATASATLGERGYAAMGLELDWGPDDEIFTVTAEDFQKYSMKIFGHTYADDALKGLRDLFRNITTLYAYKLTSGGVKAANAYATAKYTGERGNDIKIVIRANVDTPTDFDVLTYVGTTAVDSQTVTAAADLADNDYVTFDATATLAVTAGEPLTGGTNGTADAAAHQKFLDKLESYTSVNAVGYVGDDSAIKALYAAYVERLRDSVGTKLQAVLYGQAADYEGVVNVKNSADLVWWATGVIAGTAVNASASNKVYDGEFDIPVDYTQSQLEAAIKAGEWVVHQVTDQKRVLEDINSLVTTSDTKGDVFKDNQTIRVIDQIATDIANVFVTKYLGVVPNDAAGRTSLWADIVKHHEQLQDIRAIEDFSDEDVTVEQGDTKKAVVVADAVTVVGTMTKLYMTVTVN